MEISAKKYYFIRGIIWFLVIVAIVLVLAYFFSEKLRDFRPSHLSKEFY